jgi:hypothetical protein
MAGYNDLIKQQVSNAFKNILAPNGLSEEITVKYFVSEGAHNVEDDTTETIYNEVKDVVVIVAKPGFDDVKNHGVVFSDAKLIIPGPFIPSEPQVDTDKVIRANGEEWDIRKVVGVPGGGVWTVFIYRT